MTGLFEFRPYTAEILPQEILVRSQNPLRRQSNPCLMFHRVATVKAEVFISVLKSRTNEY
jgi:hypothetical protein